MKKSLIRILLFALIILIVVMTACTGKPTENNTDKSSDEITFNGEKITVAVWVAQEEPELGKSPSQDAAYYALKQACEKYDVEVEYKITTQTDHFNQFISNSMSDIPYADIVMSHSWNHVGLIKQGLQTPTDKYLEAMDEEERDKWATDLVKFGEHYYGLHPKPRINLPIDYLFYNRTRLQELGLQDPQELALEGKWDWDTFYDYCVAATDTGKDRYGASMYGLHNVLGNSNNVISVVFDESDGRYYNGFTHESSKKGNMECLEFINKLAQQNVVLGNWIRGQEAMDMAENSFLDGQTLFTFAQNGERLKKLGMGEFGVVTAPMAEFNTDKNIYNNKESFAYWMIPTKTNFPADDIAEFWIYAKTTWDESRGDAYYDFDIDEYKEELLDRQYTDMRDVEFLLTMAEKVIETPSLDLACSLGSLIPQDIYIEVISGNSTAAAAVAATDNPIQAKIDEALNDDKNSTSTNGAEK